MIHLMLDASGRGAWLAGWDVLSRQNRYVAHRGYFECG